MGLDYAKAKRMQSARGCRPETFGPRSSSLQGWRTEWDGEPFPVTTTLIKAGDNTMDTMRAIDGNGHVPDESAATQSDYDRGYSAGYNQALLNVIEKLAQQAMADLAAINDRLEQFAQRPAA